MAFLDTAFDVADLPQSTTGNFEPLPAGWYAANITRADLTPTTAGTGKYIKIRYDITGPTHQGRVVFGNLNIQNPSAQAEEIGRAQLGELMRAIGLTRVTDTDQLLGAHVMIKLDVRPSRTDERTGKTYEASNEVRGYRAVSGAAPSATSPATPAPAASASAAPPWAARR